MGTARVKNRASDRQTRLQGRRVVGLSRRQIITRDNERAAQIAAEALADIRAGRTEPEDAPALDLCDECGVGGGRHHPDCEDASIDDSLDDNGTATGETDDAGETGASSEAEPTGS